MFDFFRTYQFDMMTGLIAISVMIAIFASVSKVFAPKRRRIIVCLALGAACLVIADRLAYAFRGVDGTLAFVMVRLTNFAVFAFSLINLQIFNEYLKDLYLNEGGRKEVPLRIKVVDYLVAAGVFLIFVSQFTGIYYYFDEHNTYHRGPLFFLCYIMPVFIMVIQISSILQHGKALRKSVRWSIFLFTSCPLIASAIQAFAYGISLTNMTVVFMVVVIYLIALQDANQQIEWANESRIEHLEEEQQRIYQLFDQTVTAFVGAIDAKDPYSKGHSARVANYASILAEKAGKTRKECREIYYAAMLHEVGKIGIPDSIVSKDHALTDEEYTELKRYPEIGSEILSNITEFPFLKVGALYHHEWYDGTGYPEGLVGEEIPEMARIIAVADAYDTMTSQRSYRDPLSQLKVREELVKGMDTQFDPKYAKLMLELIDNDSEYIMQERHQQKEFSENSELLCGAYRDHISEGFSLMQKPVRVHFTCEPRKSIEEDVCMPAVILFDSLDARVHTNVKDIENLNYVEYGELWLDGYTISSAARNMKSEYNKVGDVVDQKEAYDLGESIEYELFAVKVKDHVLVRTTSIYGTMETVVALADNSGFAYLAFTGEHCHIGDVVITREEEEVPEDYIPRIASEINYINRLEGDVPNVQIDGYRSASTEGVLVTDGMELNFYVMMLPAAQRVWQCPFINVFYSKDKKPYGEDYREYALIRFDGETENDGNYAINKLTMKKTSDFTNWDDWKNIGKQGFEASVVIRRFGNRITTVTSNNGISIKNVTTITDDNKEIYVSLTGDQVALTDIRIRS